MSEAFSVIERAALIARFAEKRPTMGRTALMKYAYFLKTLRGVPLPYDFTLYSYGPYDSCVLDDLKHAESLGAVNINVIHYPSGYGYDITGGSTADRVKQLSASFLFEYERDIDWVIANFGSMNAGELELASTIVYVDREYMSLSMRDLVVKVGDIKPRFTEQQIEDRARGLKARGLLDSPLS